METISINNPAASEKDENKKGKKISDNAKASITAAVTGVGAGIAGMAVAGKIMGETNNINEEELV